VWLALIQAFQEVVKGDKHAQRLSRRFATESSA
jgi:hypothetical protein